MKKLFIILLILFPMIVFGYDYDYDDEDDFPWAVSWSMGFSGFEQNNREDLFQDGVNGAFTVEFHMQEYFAFGFKTGFFYFNHKQRSSSDLQLGFFNLMATFIVNGPSSFRPFFFFGPGMYSQDADSYSSYDNDGNTVYYDYDSRYYGGFTAGVGFEVLFRRSFGITSSLSYHKIFTDDDIDIIGGEFGIKYYF